MVFEFKLPELGENIENGDVVSVMVAEGDVIAANQNVVEIETDKAAIEVPCPKGGKVTKILVKKGDTIAVGQTVLTLEASDTKGAPAKPKPGAAPAKAEPSKTQPTKTQPAAPEAKKPQPAPSRPAAATEKPAPKAPAASAKAAPVKEAAKPDAKGQRAEESPKVNLSEKPASQPAPQEAAEDSNGAQVAPAGPAVRRLARELGVDLARVTGTGGGGRITREDIVAAVRQANQNVKAGVGAQPGAERDKYGDIRREKLTRMRKTIAENMVRSATTIPHLTNFDDADITELERIRKGSTADYVGSNIKLTTMPFLMKAVALALRAHPTLNASLDMEAGEIVYKDYVNLGIAVDTERGLMVPVVRGVDRMTIPQLAQALTTAGEKARTFSVDLEDQRGGSFTISNLGAIGGVYSTPIINYPEVAILLVGRSRKMPVVTKEDKIEVRLMMPLSLSYDHRLVDGAAAARFLNEVKGYLETPGRLLLAP